MTCLFALSGVMNSESFVFSNLREFSSFESSGFVSNFGFRVSDLKTPPFVTD